jgi:hypothetical protein
MQINQQQLARLLEDAKEAHHEYQKSIAGTDDNWAEWYAEYIHNQLNNTDS